MTTDIPERCLHPVCSAWWMYDNHTFQPVDVTKPKWREHVMTCYDIDGCGSFFVRESANGETIFNLHGGGKGDKDRVTCLPQSLVFRLQAHLDRIRVLYDQDRAAGSAPIYLPDGLERKFPNGGREWTWFWLFPAGQESRDPRLGIWRRHHVHENTLGKALKLAARRAGLTKRVTAHTLRHSFATNLLAGGASITQVQELLGHNSVETTQVYLHCIPQFAQTITSPLDALPQAANVVPFESDAAGRSARAPVGRRAA